MSRVHNKNLGVHELSDQSSLILKVEKVSGPDDVLVTDENGREVKLKYQSVKIIAIIKNESSGYTTSKMKIKMPPRSGLRATDDKPLAVGQVISVSDRQPLASPIPQGKSYYEYHIEFPANPEDKTALFFGGYYDKTLSVYFGSQGPGLVSLEVETALQSAIAIRKYFDAIRNHQLDQLKSAIADHPRSLNQTDGTWGSPLHFAVRYGNKEEVALLIKAGADRSLKDSNGRIALDFVNENPDPEILKLLKSP